MSYLPRLFAAVLALSLLAGCAAPAPIPSASGSLPPLAETGLPAAPALSASATATRRPSATPIPASATPGPSPTPTPDLRLPPEQWREWPVAPTASGTAQDIYRAGLALGNDPRRFSKVGDCQSIREVLMGVFDRPDGYTLNAQRKHLAPAIEHFAGSFNRDGMAVQGGFNAASVLSPMWANPELCQAGENPLECEFRLHKPSFVIISLEVWWDGRTPERYEQYMRRIIEYAIEKGVVPILSTKADNVEGDHAINLATARLAYEYDLPLWNWWLAAQDLPNGGLDPYRPDGFHLAYSSWNPRAFTALAALDSVWRGVQPQETAVSASATAVPSAAAPPAADVPLAEPLARPLAPMLEPTSSPTKTSPSDQVILGLARRAGETTQPGGVYRIDTKTGGKTELAGPGWQFQALSPDGRYLLLNRGAELYLTDATGLNPIRLSSAFFSGARAGALFTGPSSLAFIAAQGEQTYVVHYPLDGADWQVLTAAADHPVELYPGAAGPAGQARWGGGECEQDECRVELLAVSAPGQPTTRRALVPVLNATQAAQTATPAGAGQAPGMVGAPAGARPAWSPDGVYTAYTQSINGDKSLLVLSKVDALDAAGQGGGPRAVEMPGSYPVDLLFAPDSGRLAVLQLDRSEYSGRWGAIYTYLITPANLGIQRLADAPRGLNPRALFSPDGRRLLLTSTYPDIDGAGSQVLVGLSDLSNRPAQDLTALFALSSSADILLINSMAWLPGGSAAVGPAPIPRETP